MAVELTRVVNRKQIEITVQAKTVIMLVVILSIQAVVSVPC